MPEWLVFARAFAVGLVVAEIFRLACIAGSHFADAIEDVNPRWRLSMVVLAALLAAAYFWARQGFDESKRLYRSWRVDLLAMVVLGVGADFLAEPWLEKVHDVAEGANPLWAPTLLGVLLIIMASALWRRYAPKRPQPPPQLYFLTDDEIKLESEDILGSETQAKSFAETVLASGSNAGIVFGIDAPWGTGKTSFINLAQQYWESVKPKRVIVFRFEPLRYASDPDLADKFIRDLSAVIQREVFVPEFRPAASRYSRMLKGKADFSFLGFKFSLDPSAETVDELLDDIDAVLMRIGRRVIVIVDDLDRLDAKAVNNVLFIARRTFRLTQAAYVLCYDTEVLVAGKEDGDRARKFLEKFVNVKLSLFVDGRTLQEFLRVDWRSDTKRFPAIPADTMVKLAAVVDELANALGDDNAAYYLPLIGDLRKIKRFVNAVLLLQLDKADLGRTDFNQRDLLNLILLHLHYPGIFRRIYAEETEGRTGAFSVRRGDGSSGSSYTNSPGLVSVIKSCDRGAGFLLAQLFDLQSLELEDSSGLPESVRSSRACFNSGRHRNLESYLKLIVRFSTPEPRETFRLYQDAVEQVVSGGKKISTVLNDQEFALARGEIAHDQFWQILVSQSYDFTASTANDAISTLVDYLPRYSLVDADARGLRARSVYTLILLLDRAGWRRTGGKRRNNLPENVVEIAWRIFGEREHRGLGLIDALSSLDRGAIGWNDLMLFRLQCNADRQGQVFEVHTALIVHDDLKAQTSGDTRLLAIAGMRTISQRVFARFHEQFIKPGRNFLAAVDETLDASFFGDSATHLTEEARKQGKSEELRQRLLGTRSLAKTFVLYQLANRKPPTGSGVGCGYYDPEGKADRAGIAEAMNRYIFDVCFNPEADADNAQRFVDYCLCNLASGLWAGSDEEGYVPTRTSLADELNAEALVAYWAKFGASIKAMGLTTLDRQVHTLNYIADYKTDLPRIFDVLDSMLPISSGGEAALTAAK
jgi:hypothetical protein